MVMIACAKGLSTMPFFAPCTWLWLNRWRQSPLSWGISIEQLRRTCDLLKEISVSWGIISYKSGPGRYRTCDQSVMSRPLYH
jgi:hypothetical protein